MFARIVSFDDRSRLALRFSTLSERLASIAAQPPRSTAQDANKNRKHDTTMVAIIPFKCICVCCGNFLAGTLYTVFALTCLAVLLRVPFANAQLVANCRPIQGRKESARISRTSAQAGRKFMELL